MRERERIANTCASVAYLLLPLRSLPSENDWLTPREAAQLATFPFATRRDEWRLGRWGAKRALATVLGVGPLVRLEIMVAAGGAPYALLDGRDAGRAMSLSHAGGLALCGVAAPQTAVGVDLERIRPGSERYIGEQLTAAERAFVGAAPPERRAALATLLWSGKEAALKALGEGLRMDPRDVEVHLGAERDGDWRSLVVHTGAGPRFSGWWREGLELVITVVSNRRNAAPEAILGLPG